MKYKKKILITGGCGFIGFNLALELLKKNFKVIIIDKKITNKIRNRNVTYVKGNIKNSKVFNNFEDQYEAVFHLAAQASARICEENFKEAIETNFIGTLNLCNWAKIYKPKKIIFASSMGVYNSSKFALKENETLRPSSIYGKTKVEGEKMIKRLNKYNITTIITRLFNVYGPGQSYENLKQGMVSIYTYYAVFDKKIKVTGSLDRFRDLIYISDVSNTFIKLLKLNKSITINVGTGKKKSVSEILRLICELTNLDFNKNIKLMPSHSGDIFGTYASIDKLVKIFKPKISLKTGLLKIVKDVQKFKRKRN